MDWIILLLLAGCGYGAWRLKGRWDMELVRSHVFLDALTTGEPLDEANGTAMLVMALPSVKGIRHLAHVHVLHEFGGQRAAMIEKAYGLGMTARLSAYEREFFSVKSPRPRDTNTGAERTRGAQPHGYDMPSSTDAESRYRTYRDIYLLELRRLAGTAEGKIHPAQIMEDDNVRRAFWDRIDPYELAVMVHQANYAT